ncbi:hypothetical protein [Serinicoccus marinus]|uniref:hypothetical protein n=1 Tax=Serinicoccus marinus TaxID=247333 RepID=UPI0012F84368|nr:hypothetical protein [Serinicoccus marinus]
MAAPDVVAARRRAQWGIEELPRPAWVRHRWVLLGIAAILAVAHVSLPLWAELFATGFPEVDYLRVPFLVILGACAVAGELVLLIVWALAPALGSTSRLTPGQHVALALAVVLLLAVAMAFIGVNTYLSSIEANPPLVFLGLLVGSLVCVSVAVAFAYAQWHRR